MLANVLPWWRVAELVWLAPMVVRKLSSRILGISVAEGRDSEVVPDFELIACEVTTCFEGTRNATRDGQRPRHAQNALCSVAEFRSEPAAVLSRLPFVGVAADSEVGRVEGLDQLRGQPAILGVLPKRIVRAPGIDDVPRVESAWITPIHRIVCGVLIGLPGLSDQRVHREELPRCRVVVAVFQAVRRAVLVRGAVLEPWPAMGPPRAEAHAYGANARRERVISQTL